MAAFAAARPVAAPRVAVGAPLAGATEPSRGAVGGLRFPSGAAQRAESGATDARGAAALGLGAAAAAIALSCRRSATRRRPAGVAKPSGVALAAGVGREAGGGAVSVSSTASAEAESADNELEEFLLGVEFPSPLKPVLGSGAWASFAAALVQMGVIGGLAALGTFLEQGGPPEFYARQYPEWSGIILTLGLDKVYSSPFFLALVGWLAVSIMACTGTTQIPLAKRAQKISALSAGQLKRRGSFLVRVGCGGAAEQDAEVVDSAPSEAVTQRLCSLRAALEKRGFAVRTDNDASPTRLAAQRGLVGKFAPMVVHLSMLLVLAGNTAGLVFGASSEVLIGDGGEADLGVVLERGRRAKGPLYEMLNPFKGLLDNSKLKVEDFRIDYREDTGAVDQFYSKLVVQNAQSNERLYSDEIYVNKPLRYGGATIYQADWALDRLQMYINDFPIVVPLKQLPDQEGQRSWGAFLPQELVSSKDPKNVKKISDPSKGIVLVVENMRNVQVYGSNKELTGILRSPAAPPQKKMEGMPVQFGEEIKVEGDNVLKLDRIVGQTGLIVKSDPGVPLVYAGFAILMPATLLSVLPFGQVWAAVSEEDKNQILISGRANRNSPAFEDEMKTMVVSGAVL